MINQNGQTAPLPETDPSGPGTDNWELEESLDVEWAHAIAPGAQIVLVEANSQSLSDLMASVATAASQPGVSVVSMSWGLPEGEAVFASDEATYDSVLNAPGRDLRGQHGRLWGGRSGVSRLLTQRGGGRRHEPHIKQRQFLQQRDGMGLPVRFRRAPSSARAAASACTSPSRHIRKASSPRAAGPPPTFRLLPTPRPAPGSPTRTIWMRITRSRSSAGPACRRRPGPDWWPWSTRDGQKPASRHSNSTSPTETQQALYSLPQSDYNVITSGFNGYTANAGYNLVTGLGTPVANLLVGDLVAYQGPGTTYAGPTVGTLQDVTLVNTGSGGGGASNVFGVFSAITMSSNDLGYAQGSSVASPVSTGTNVTPGQNPVASHLMVTPANTSWTDLGLVPGSVPASGALPAHGWVTSFSPVGPTSRPPATVTMTPNHAGLGDHDAASSMGQALRSAPGDFVNQGGSEATDREALDRVLPSTRQTRLMSEAVLDELATDSAMWLAQEGKQTLVIPVLPARWGNRDLVIGDPATDKKVRSLADADYTAGLALMGLAVGLSARGSGVIEAWKRRRGKIFSGRTTI